MDIITVNHHHHTRYGQPNPMNGERVHNRSISENGNVADLSLKMCMIIKQLHKKNGGHNGMMVNVLRTHRKKSTSHSHNGELIALFL